MGLSDELQRVVKGPLVRKLLGPGQELLGLLGFCLILEPLLQRGLLTFDLHLVSELHRELPLPEHALLFLELPLLDGRGDEPLLHQSKL